MTGSLDAVASLVGHLRARVGAPGDGDVLGTDLATSPGLLTAEVAKTAAGRGSDDPQVLASLWWQAYAYRVAGTTLAAWVVAGAAPDPSAPGTGVGIARSRPSSLLVDPTTATIEHLPTLVERLFAGHLDGVAAALHASHPLGDRLLWGNAAAGVASALGAVQAAEGAPPLRDRIATVTGTLPHEISTLGRWADIDGRWHYQRTSCCLWWKTSAANGALCADCSLPRAPDPSGHEAVA